MSCSIIITFRNDEHSYRLRNLQVVLKWLSESTEIDVILVEQDRLRRAVFDAEYPNVRHALVYNTGAFNKSWGFNVGVRFSQSAYLCFCDADTLLDVPIQSIIAHTAYGTEVIKPHRNTIDLTPEQTDQLRQSQSDAYLKSMQVEPRHQRSAKGEFSSLASAMIVISRKAFDRLGGWDERFVGWGGEDDAMSHKIQRLRLSTLELAQHSAYHLWHPQPHTNTFGQAAYKSNLAIVQRYKRMTNDELDWLMAVQKQGHGNANKYRPREGGNQ